MLRTRFYTWQCAPRPSPSSLRLVSHVHAARRAAALSKARDAACTAARRGRGASLASGGGKRARGSGGGGDSSPPVAADERGAGASNDGSELVAPLEAALRHAAGTAEARQAAFAQRLASAGALGAHGAGVLDAYAAIQRDANEFIIRGHLQLAAAANAPAPAAPAASAEAGAPQEPGGDGTAASSGAAAANGSGAGGDAPVEQRFTAEYRSDLSGFGGPRLGGLVRDIPSLLACEPRAAEGGGGQANLAALDEGPRLPPGLERLSELAAAVALAGGALPAPADVPAGFFSAAGIR